MKRSTFIVSALAGAAFANVSVLYPPTCENCTEIAVVWVPGPDYSVSDYMDIAVVFQDEAANIGLSAWVGIPVISYTTPSADILNTSVPEAVKKL
jgi:hypothetical protein